MGQPEPRRRAARRFPARHPTAVFVVSLVALHSLWAIAVSSFGGFDEAQHYYRGVGVASGSVLGPSLPGQPDAVRVTAVPGRQFPVCDADPSACTLTDPARGGPAVGFPTSAGVYPPLYYAVAGAFARPFDWPASLLAMRLGTAALSAALGGLCFWATRAVWPARGNPLALLCVATPSTVFLSATATPSGVEVWAATTTAVLGLGVVRRVAEGRVPPRSWQVAFAVAAATLALDRPTSPLVLAVVLVAVAVVAAPLRAQPAVLGRAVRRMPAASAVVLVALVLAAAWSIPTWPSDASANALPLPTGRDLVAYLRTALWQHWNTLVGVPNDWIASPAAHLVLSGLVILTVALALLSSAGRRLVVLVVLAVAVLLAGVVANLSTGYGWYQGRYALPVAAALYVIAGEHLVRADALPGTVRRRLVRGGAFGWGLAHVVYYLDYFGLPDLAPVVGTDSWSTSFLAKVDALPSAVAAAGILALLLASTGGLVAAILASCPAPDRSSIAPIQALPATSDPSAAPVGGTAPGDGT